MELKFRCIKCNRKLEAAATMAGETVPCPNCGSAVTIPEAVLAPGVTLAGFRIEKEIGCGAMERVFLAIQLTTSYQVALKVLSSSQVADSEDVERFFQECRIATRLEHPHIVAALDAGEDHGYHYLAMTYIEGESLDQRLKRDKILPEAEALAITRIMADALAYAWDKFRLLHRNLKPANIMVDRDGQVFLMDLGLAKSFVDQSHLTTVGVTVGTPSYMSPEQARGSQSIDFRADMYSLGVTLFHLVAGRAPFIGTSAAEVVAKHLYDPVPSVRSFRPEVSKECEAIIARMMAKQPSERHGDWGALIAGIDHVLRAASPAAPFRVPS